MSTPTTYKLLTEKSSSIDFAGFGREELAAGPLPEIIGLLTSLADETVDSGDCMKGNKTISINFDEVDPDGEPVTVSQSFWVSPVYPSPYEGV